MFQPGKAAIRTVRLPKQSAEPSFADVQFLFAEGSKVMGRSVELPWAAADKKGEYVISVNQPNRESEAQWSMSQVSSAGTKVLWTYASSDLSLIFNLISSHTGGTELKDAATSEQLMLAGPGTGKTAEVQKPQGIVFDPPKQGAVASLEGELKSLSAPGLMQQIYGARMTGKLDIKTHNDHFEAYFVQGTPLHCRLKDTVGDAAMIDLMLWRNGEYRFWPDEVNQDRTMLKSMDDLLKEGIALIDQFKYLETAGLRLESTLVKKNTMISEEEFSARVSKGIQFRLDKQMDFYEHIDNRSTLFDLLRKRPQSKADWVPILFNLVSCGLIQLTDAPPQYKNRWAGLKALGIDETQVQAVVKNLIKAETGIMTYPAMIYFLDQEFMRYEHFNIPFSLIVFSLGQRRVQDGPVEMLQLIAVRRAMQRIGLVKRPVDLLAHHEQVDYALLLPNTNSAAASALATKIVEVLREAPLSSDMDVRGLALAFGVATVPEDCQELDKVLSAARKARDKSKQTHQRVVLAREVTPQT